MPYMADQFHGAKANNCSGVSAMMEGMINAFFRRKIQKPEEIFMNNQSQFLHFDFDFDIPDQESKLLILVKDLDKDFAKLKFRELSVERNGTYKKIETAKSIFGTLLPTRIRGNYWWTLGMTWEAIRLIGLENLMIYMYDQPENLHRLMKFLMNEHISFADWFEKQGLLTPVNEDDYVGSGGVAYTEELPQKDWHEGDRVRLKDIWGLSESRETVGVGPEMFAEFILKYQVPVTNKF